MPYNLPMRIALTLDRDAVGQRLPGLDLGPFAAHRRNELAYRRQGIEVFHDHARIEERIR